MMRRTGRPGRPPCSRIAHFRKCSLDARNRGQPSHPVSWVTLWRKPPCASFGGVWSAPPAPLRKRDGRRDTLSHEALGVPLHLVSGDNWRGRDGRTADSAGGYCDRREATEGKRERKREGGQSRTKARGRGAGAGRGSLAVDATDRGPFRRGSRCN